MKLPKTPKGAYNDINRRFFDAKLPEDIEFRAVEPGGANEDIDTRCQWATVVQEGNRYTISFDARLLEIRDLQYMVMGHEALHIALGLDVPHGSAKWNAGYRKLLGQGFFRRVF